VRCHCNTVQHSATQCTLYHKIITRRCVPAMPRIASQHARARYQRVGACNVAALHSRQCIHHVCANLYIYI